MNAPQFCKSGLIAMLSCIAFAGTALADTIIYQDNFSGPSVNPQNGATTNIGGGTWTAGPGWKADGTFSGASGEFATLPFTPAAGNVYTLSANISIPSENGLMFFFGNTTSSVFDVGGGNLDNIAGMRFDSFGSTLLQFAHTDRDADGEFTYYPDNATKTPVPQGGLATIVLDTNNPTWSATFSYGGINFGSSTGIVPGSINKVGFSEQWFVAPTVAVDNFSLSVAAVPEPSTCLLALVGVGVVVFFRRSHRSASLL